MCGIGEIEDLPAQFQPRRFCQAEVAPDQEVEIHQPRSAQHVASRIAIGECRRHGKCRRIKPTIHAAFTTRETSVAQPIRAHRAGRVGGIACDIGIDRLSRLRHEDTADLETTEHGPRDFRSSQPSVCAPVRQVIHNARHKAVFDVETRRAFLGIGIEWILRNVRAVAVVFTIGGVVNRVAPCVRLQQRKAGLEASFELRLQRVIAGVCEAR